MTNLFNDGISLLVGEPRFDPVCPWLSPDRCSRHTESSAVLVVLIGTCGIVDGGMT